MHINAFTNHHHPLGPGNGMYPTHICIYIYISMQFSQHVLEGTFAEGLNVCVFDCGHLGPLSHRGHDPIDRLVEK